MSTTRKQRFLVTASHGPASFSSTEMAAILEHCIFPTFATLEKMEKAKVILAGGLPVGERALVFILEAASVEAADRILRELPAWGVLEWKVAPLVSFLERDKEDHLILAKMKKQVK